MRYLIPILLLLFLFSPLEAQEDSALPVLRAEDIFAEGVTVLERLPVVWADNEARVLYYFNPVSTTWESYDYPVELEQISLTEARSDGTFRLQILHNIANANVSAENNWLFSPNEGVIPVPTICNLVQAAEGEGQWSFTKLAGEDSYRLCNTETGETSPILSSELQTVESTYCRYPDRLNLFPSPDNRYFAIIQCSVDWLGEYHVYAYELAAQQLFRLGNFTPNNLTALFQSVEFFNEHEFILTMGDLEYEVFKADLSQPESLHSVVYMPSLWPTSINQFQYLYFDNGTGFLYLADLATEETRQFLDYPIESEGRIPMEMGKLGLSPDGRYLAYSYFANWTYNAAIFDLEAEQIIQSWSYDRAEVDEFIWLSPSSLFIPLAVQNFSFSGIDYWRISRIDIGDTVERQDIVTIDVPFHIGFWSPSPDKRFIPIQNSETSYQLYDAENEQLMEFMSIPEEFDHFDVDFEWRDNETMLVQVGYNKWRIHIEALPEEQL